MMLSLCELRRAAQIVEETFSGATLRRVEQPDEHRLVLTLEGSEGKVHILLSCHPQFARICLAEAPEQVSSLSSFCQYARAHLKGNALSEIGIAEGNRQIALHFQGRADSFVLLFSILGPRSNIYLLDQNGKRCLPPAR